MQERTNGQNRFHRTLQQRGSPDKESDETESQLDSNEPELRFRACSNTVCNVPEIHDGEDP